MACCLSQPWAAKHLRDSVPVKPNSIHAVWTSAPFADGQALCSAACMPSTSQTKRCRQGYFKSVHVKQNVLFFLIVCAGVQMGKHTLLLAAGVTTHTRMPGSKTSINQPPCCLPTLASQRARVHCWHQQPCSTEQISVVQTDKHFKRHILS